MMFLDERRLATIAGTGAVTLMASILFAIPPVSHGSGIQTGDSERGKSLFEKRCTGCHSLDQNKEGPRLRDVYGRKPGAVADFQYSNAFKSAQWTWDDGLLDKWLTDTESVLPNNDMAFRVPSAEERADIIAFLRDSAESAQHP